MRSCEKRNDELSSQVPYIREGDLENRVTNLLHEIGIPAHIKGYHLSAGFDHHGSAGYGCVKCDHKGVVSNRSKTVSDDIQPCGAGNPSCDRGSMESWKLDTLDELFGYTVSTGKGKPTNSEFVALIADTIQLEYKHR